MNETPTTLKTKAERRAIFAQLFADTAPADQPALSTAARIREYRAEILAYHAKGYSWAQIQEKLKMPPISIDAAIPTIVKSVSRKPRKKAESLPVISLSPRSTPAVATSAGAPASDKKA